MALRVESCGQSERPLPSGPLGPSELRLHPGPPPRVVPRTPPGAQLLQALCWPLSARPHPVPRAVKLVPPDAHLTEEKAEAQQGSGQPESSSHV